MQKTVAALLAFSLFTGAILETYYHGHSNIPSRFIIVDGLMYILSGALAGLVLSEKD